MNQNITIRMGAARNDITVGSLNVDLSTANKTQRYEARRALIEGLKEQGYFGKKEQRKAIYRNRREAQQ
ncbi:MULTISPECIES: hypothetical protein [Sinorhizobium]|uniref:hypothetical protein n=1 Tax=Sinorhizobium TaxID=28105 RepID=UPI000FDAD444|nr:hypothetical protein [Sinorhizobium medicae]MDW9532284.1 hypothetical protein [Sinorhizobium meliloti]RVH84253.1 hypothetical protein CN201_26800 [Sinorhizobium medicae]RVP50033.1 hypothetical protein CN078_21585 [Sinorhizobium medicae]RVP63855.1 hypothetical protein CN074_24995 [Sinorhizobium medicae]RVP74847.1 hypothetical protein CN079_20960 [Sinorhizobium medicae]